MNYEQKYKEALERAKEICVAFPLSKSTRNTCETIFPELRESEDERMIRIIENAICTNEAQELVKTKYGLELTDLADWLEKRGEQSFAIRWHDVSLIPREMEELLVEWDSNDATWHDVAFYHADSKTFWNGERRVEDVTRWCYIDDLLEKQSEPKPTDAEMKELLRTEYEKGRADAIAETQVAWSEEDKRHVESILERLKGMCKKGATYIITRFAVNQDIDWLKSLKPQPKQE